MANRLHALTGPEVGVAEELLAQQLELVCGRCRGMAEGDSSGGAARGRGAVEGRCTGGSGS